MKFFKKLSFSWYFFITTIIIMLVILIISPSSFNSSLFKFLDLLVKIIPFLIIVFILMFLANYFITPKIVKKYLLNKNKGLKWFFAVIFGIISTGPIYMWYPFLADLKPKGIKEGMIATFLYARAIKPALIPLMIYYFGLFYTILFTIFIIIFSLIQGSIINKMEVEK